MTSAMQPTEGSRPVAIEVQDLHKHYGSLRAVDGISLRVHTGEIYALLGRNGAGKTTAVEILEGHRSRTSGLVSVLGMDPESGGRDLRDRIGVVLQSTGIEPELSVREALGLYGRVYTRRAGIDDLIERVGLEAKADARIGTLSGGQRRRVDLALGLVGEPELLFLDEPTTGFDPAARHQSWELIAGLRDGGTTVVLTTHYLEEAEHLADRVGVISNGAMVAEGTPGELAATLGGTSITVGIPEATAAGQVADLVAGLDAGLDTTATQTTSVRVTGQMIEIFTTQATAVLFALTTWATERSLEFTALEVTRPSLEDVFMDLSDTGARRDAVTDGVTDGVTDV